MTEYRGNVLIQIERALSQGARSVALTVEQCRQLLDENAALVTKANELVRLNYDLLAKVAEIKKNSLS